MKELFQKIRELSPNSKNVLFTVLDGENFGSKLILSNDEKIFEFDAKTSGKSSLSFFNQNMDKILSLKESGISEIGGVKIYAEFFSNEKKLYICGGGHDSIPVIKIAKMIGMNVAVLEDREEFAENAKSSGADKIYLGEYEDSLKKISGDEDSFFVIITRGHKWDLDCLRQIAKKPYAYIGMMGSHRRVSMILERLKSEGIDENVLNSVHAPIGLKINSETPEEIAVSILAEIIQVKNSTKGNFGISKNILNALEECSSKKEIEPAVISTIVQRKGSAPRQIGTKMLVKSDGTVTDTIGGGSIENDVIKISKKMLAEKDYKPRLIHVEMTADEADIDGMVCGGAVDVLLETIK